MDQIKIGKFIAERRKNLRLTQAELAIRLSITDRAVSKWENGKAMPDSSIMLGLCEALGITVNDLLSGEVVTMENYNKEMENKLLEMVKEKEQKDRQLLTLEIVVGVLLVAILLATTAVAAYVQMEGWLRILLVVIGLVPIVVAIPFLIRIEQTAGYYECKVCSHRYIPTFSSVFWAMHMGRTRYMKCPKCGKMSWQKKKLTK